MTQELISLNFTEADLAEIDAALDVLERKLGGLVSLSVLQRKRLRRMGEKSETFCRQALNVVGQNPQMIPANVPVAVAIDKMRVLDQLRPRMVRLGRFMQRAGDTDVALGNDVMGVALQAYGLLKLTGRAEGLEAMRKNLSVRFVKSPRSAAAAKAT